LRLLASLATAQQDTVLCVNTRIIFSIAAVATVTELTIASVFIHAFEHFQVISES
jgi:uncharacterized ferredoxin-like protein